MYMHGNYKKGTTVDWEFATLKCLYRGARATCRKIKSAKNWNTWNIFPAKIYAVNFPNLRLTYGGLDAICNEGFNSVVFLLLLRVLDFHCVWVRVGLPHGYIFSWHLGGGEGVGRGRRVWLWAINAPNTSAAPFCSSRPHLYCNIRQPQQKVSLF